MRKFAIPWEPSPRHAGQVNEFPISHVSPVLGLFLLYPFALKLPRRTGMGNGQPRQRSLGIKGAHLRGPRSEASWRASSAKPARTARVAYSPRPVSSIGATGRAGLSLRTVNVAAWFPAT